MEVVRRTATVDTRWDDCLLDLGSVSIYRCVGIALKTVITAESEPLGRVQLHPFFDGEIASVLELKIARRLLIIFVLFFSQKNIEIC